MPWISQVRSRVRLRTIRPVRRLRIKNSRPSGVPSSTARTVSSTVVRMPRPNSAPRPSSTKLLSKRVLRSEKKPDRVDRIAAARAQILIPPE